MKTFQSAIFLLVAAAGNVGHACAQGLVLPGSVFVSPDKMCSLAIEDYDREYHFKVENLNSGKSMSFEDEYSRIFAVKWTSNSKSIFVAAHCARGKLLDMIHNDGKRWKLEEVTPREDREYESEVLGWNFEKEKVHLSFKVMVYTKIASDAFYKCSFDFDPSSGQRSNYKKYLMTSNMYRDTKSSLAPD